MSKSILIIDTPTNCFECPCFMEMGWRCQCRLDIDDEVHDGRPNWCPLKEEVKAIPTTWIEQFMNRFATPQGVCGDEYALLHYMLTEWENENETRFEHKAEKMGKWIIDKDCEGKTRTCTCSICGYKTGPYTWENPNFCANCGADMRGRLRGKTE